MYIDIYVGQARWSLGATGRYERGSAIAANRPLFAPLTTFARLSFHYQPPPCHFSASVNGIAIGTVCTRVFEFFSKYALLHSRAKARGSIATQKPRRKSRLYRSASMTIFLIVRQKICTFSNEFFPQIYFFIYEYK